MRLLISRCGSVIMSMDGPLHPVQATPDAMQGARQRSRVTEPRQITPWLRKHKLSSSAVTAPFFSETPSRFSILRSQSEHTVFPVTGGEDAPSAPEIAEAMKYGWGGQPGRYT